MRQQRALALETVTATAHSGEQQVTLTRACFLVAAFFGSYDAAAEGSLTPFQHSYRAEYITSCTKELISGPDAAPAELAVKICSCAANSLVNKLSDDQLRKVEARIAKEGNASSAATVLAEITQQCSEVIVPGYMEEHPEYVQELLRGNPDLLR